MLRTVIHFVIAAGLLLVLPQTACSTTTGTSPSPEIRQPKNQSPKRLLFVGNSYLYYNDSVHNHVRRIAEEMANDKVAKYEYKSATIGGARLAQHPIEMLLKVGHLGVERPFELVILQGGSMEVLNPGNREQFRKSANQLNDKIRATGAEVALYMTHAYVRPHKRFEPNQIKKIAEAYVSVGNELGALVIPVGLAFERAYAQRPEIVLHKPFDGTHPSLLGTYLAACVVFQSIYDVSAKTIRYDYFGAVSGKDAAFLREVADETVRDFFRRD